MIALEVDAEYNLSLVVENLPFENIQPIKKISSIRFQLHPDEVETLLGVLQDFLIAVRDRRAG